MLVEVRGLISLFLQHCSDKQTLDRLQRMTDDRASWRKAHALFNDIREKTLKADGDAEIQYLFEEACAKTLYNLTHEPAPFDPDSPYWIVPNALDLANSLGLDANEVIRIVTRRP